MAKTRFARTSKVSRPATGCRNQYSTVTLADLKRATHLILASAEKHLSKCILVEGCVSDLQWRDKGQIRLSMPLAIEHTLSLA